VTPLDAYFAARRAEVDEALTAWSPAPPDCPPSIAEAMRYSLLGGGKRLRPVLALTAADAVAVGAGRDAAQARALALPVACAVEMIHTYSLVHDDLPAMDDDTMRRGRPTNHVVHGEAMAILAGDGLQAEAFALVAREPQADDPTLARRKVRAIAVLARAAGAAGMVGGQAIDLAAVTPGRDGQLPAPLDGPALADMHARKTGALIRAAVVGGAVMAGADEATAAALDAYAREIGLAFQIVDDILDVEGESVALGKTAGKDAAAGKPTYPSLYGLERSRAMAAACVIRAEAALEGGGLSGTLLVDLARWIIARRA
jgi:geranylgeranyl pyrophosphate synthase